MIRKPSPGRSARSRCARVAAAAGTLLALAGVSFPCEAGGGAISGTVSYAGIAPRPHRLAISKDKDVCGAQPLYDQALVVGSNGGIANAVVTLSGIAKGRAPKPDRVITFDQKGCEYTPHVIAFPAGSTVKVLNSDGILHSIHTESQINPVIDMAQPGFKKSIAVRVDQPEAIKVTCDAHNWMEGWWYVTANPYFAVTDSSGRFSIPGVPPGTYTLQVWQEKLGTESQRVTIKPGNTVTANFTMKPGGE